MPQAVFAPPLDSDDQIAGLQMSIGVVNHL
jgi:hypothetical protein